MKIKIYQIDHYRDENDLKFMDLAYAKKHRGPEFPDSSIYNKVFDGEVLQQHRKITILQMIISSL